MIHTYIHYVQSISSRETLYQQIFFFKWTKTNVFELQFKEIFIKKKSDFRKQRQNELTLILKKKLDKE